MKNSIIVVAICILICATNIVCQNKDKLSLDKTEISKLRQVMLSGSLVERTKALKRLEEIKTIESFNIASLELDNNKEINDVREAVATLIRIDPERAITLIKYSLKDTNSCKRCDVLFGICDANAKVMLDFVRDYAPKNMREKAAISYMHCKNNVNYDKHFSELISILLNKKLSNPSLVGKENFGANDDAAVYLGEIADTNALLALNKAATWADGAFGEDVSEAIENIKMK